MISSFTWGLLTQTVLWPLTVTLLGLVFALLLRRRIPQLTGAAALAAGFLAGYGLIYASFAFPPRQSLDWLPILALAAWPLSMLVRRPRFPAWLRMLIGATFVLLAGALLLAPLLPQAGWMRAAGTLLVIGALWAGAWFYLDHIAPRGAAAGVVLLVIAAGNAAVAVLAGSVMLGQLGGAASAALGGWLLLNWPCPRIPLGHAGTAVMATALAGLMLVGRFYADTPVLPALLLLAALGTSACALFLVERYRPESAPAITTLWVGVAALVPVIAAVGLAVYQHFSSSGA